MITFVISGLRAARAKRADNQFPNRRLRTSILLGYRILFSYCKCAHTRTAPVAFLPVENHLGVNTSREINQGPINKSLNWPCASVLRVQNARDEREIFNFPNGKMRICHARVAAGERGWPLCRGCAGDKYLNNCRCRRKVHAGWRGARPIEILSSQQQNCKGRKCRPALPALIY